MRMRAGKKRASTKKLSVVVAEEEQSQRTTGDHAHAVINWGKKNNLGLMIIVHNALWLGPDGAPEYRENKNSKWYQSVKAFPPVPFNESRVGSSTSVIHQHMTKKKSMDETSLLIRRV